jgi:hypothetical protein
LAGTKSLGLIYRNQEELELELVGYSDADWGGCHETRRSTTGYVFTLGGAAITWASRLQPTVAQSSCEAEYMAMCAATREAVYLRLLLQELGVNTNSGTVIYVDNQGAIALAQNPAHHKLTKHIAIQYHFTRERVASGEITLAYMPTVDQLADILTKALPANKIPTLRDAIMGTA